MFEATTGSVIMNVVKIGAQFDSPNQMREMTIHTNTEVELSTVKKSRTTPRASGERNPASARPIDTTTAAPKPTAMRPSDAAVCVQSSPLRTISPKPRPTANGDGRMYAPYRHESRDHT